MKKLLGFSAGIVLGLVLTVAGYKEWRGSKTLAVEGKSAVAEVTYHSSSKSRRGARKYYLTLVFETESKHVRSQKVPVSASTYHNAVAGGTVQVHYHPSKPDLVQAGPQVEIKYAGLVGGLLLLGFSIGTWVFYRGSTKGVAKSVNALAHAQHDYRAVDARDFKHLDLAFYDALRRDLEAEGYRFLEDTVQVTNGKSGNVFVRSLVGPDGATVAAVYHMRVPAFLRLLGAKDSKVVEFETVFNNGQYVITSNAEAAGKLDYPHVMDSTWLADGTPLPLVLRSHEQHLQSFRQKHPTAAPVPIHTPSDMYRLQSDMDRIKADFRKANGLSEAELQRIAGQDGGEGMTILHQDLAKAHANQNRKA